MKGKALNGLSIAVVDAVVEASKGLVDLLCACGHDAYWTEGNDAACGHVLARGPAAVLMGMELSSADGCSMAEALRTGGYRGCIIAMAPLDEGSDHVDESWFDYIWRKPLNAHDVITYALCGTWLRTDLRDESDAWTLCAQEAK